MGWRSLKGLKRVVVILLDYVPFVGTGQGDVQWIDVCWAGVSH